MYVGDVLCLPKELKRLIIMKNTKKNSKKKSKSELDPLDSDLTPLLMQRGWKRMRFELMPKNKSITLRLSEELLEAIKREAKEEGLDYQKWIRSVIEQALNRPA
jgi:predicted DNA binding CopG/RHH family protein